MNPSILKRVVNPELVRRISPITIHFVTGYDIPGSGEPRRSALSLPDCTVTGFLRPEKLEPVVQWTGYIDGPSVHRRPM